MEYLVAACTDVGIHKETNQDSVTVKVAKTRIGNVAMVVMCDGMGGLALGEVASADVVNAFSKWFYNSLPFIIKTGLSDGIIRSEWEKIVNIENRRLSEYGAKNGIAVGTTLCVGLFTDERYYILNVGDSRAYELRNNVRVITEDQTLVESEFRKGLLTREQADNDPRKSILLQCIGASPVVIPDMFFGATQKDAVYMFCSDGFRHVLLPEEIYAYLGPEVSNDEEIMSRNGTTLIETNKLRNEKDNISVAFIRTY
jgi:serine/threonine protein phosphatase PrpC